MFISKKELNSIYDRLMYLEHQNDILFKYKKFVDESLVHLSDKINKVKFGEKYEPAKPAAKKRGRPAGSKNKVKKAKNEPKRIIKP